MEDKYILTFISQENFEKHVKDTLNHYNDQLKAFDLDKFNSNLIDPIKLMFDKFVYNKSYEDIISLEIHRQRDKANNNAIGYFHQNIFKYIDNCEVPDEGWDVVYTSDETDYYIEMKNKHNTMNSTSSKGTYNRMKKHIEASDNNDVCALVEVIAKRSQDIPWVLSIDKVRQDPNDQIRRISIDKFYEIVTGDPNAFHEICEQLPITINKVISQNEKFQIEEDTVFKELSSSENSTLTSLYKLAFDTYEGFNAEDNNSDENDEK